MVFNGEELILVELVKDVDVIMFNWVFIIVVVIGVLDRIKIVVRLGIGFDNIDVGYCFFCGIMVINVLDYCLIEVVEYVLV